MFKGKYLLFIITSVIVVFTAAAYSQPKRKKAYVDPTAMRILKAMSDHLAGLKQFSFNVVNMREDLTRTGHRVDFEVSAKVIVDRPNRIKLVRQGHLIDQEIYYDGKSLVIYHPGKKIYSTVDAPATIDEILKFAREKLGIGYPAADLMYSEAYPLLTKNVRSATVIGKEMIDGHRCDHLLFTLPGVDFQIWIPDRGDPLPFKYIVTDTGTRQLLSIVAKFDSWIMSPHVEDDDFIFTPPKDARAIAFRTVDGKTIPPRSKQ